MSKKVVKLSNNDISRMVDRILEEDNKKGETSKKKVVTETKKKTKIIRLTESQMVEFLERTAKRVKAAKQRRAK